MTGRKVVSRDEWLEARRALLAEEKALTRQRDALCEKRRALPWVRIDKAYRFEGPDGARSLAELFDGRPQLIVYHFMYGPGWKEGCDGCSFVADHFDGALRHLPHGGATLVAVSRAPYAEFEGFKQRMGWQFPWVSSHGSDFNFDFDVSYTEESLSKGPAYHNFREIPEKKPGESHGISVFHRDEDGTVYHTYSCHARGVEEVLGTFMLLDMTPLGRNETSVMDWVRLHDQYETQPGNSCGC